MKPTTTPRRAAPSLPPPAASVAFEPGGEDPLARGSSEHYADPGYYEYTYRSRREDVAFYRRLARQHGGPVLEVGGGSGRVALPLVQDGHEVIVLDASAAMLARGQERAEAELDAAARKRIRFVHGDMRDFALGRKFPLVIAPFNVLLHLYEPDDFARCFRAVGRHLTPEGRFVFDVRVPIPSELARNPDRRYKGRPFRHPTLGYRVNYDEAFRYDPIKQVQHVTMRFHPGEGAPRGAKTVEVLLTQRQIFPNELRALLALGGLALAGRRGDFDGAPLTAEDTLEIVTARKAVSPPRPR
jgi:SAM-dependent methyltransferase